MAADDWLTLGRFLDQRDGVVDRFQELLGRSR